MVHNPDHEGSLMVDRRTGVIVTPLMERPEWADGLAVALLEEHRQFYESRTGSYEQPALFALGDLGWIGVDSETGEEMEQSASDGVRQERLATLLGADAETGDITGYLAEIELSFDTPRSPEEASAIEDAQEEGFSEIAKQA